MGPKRPVGRPKKFATKEKKALQLRVQAAKFKPEPSTTIKPPLFDHEVSVADALALADDWEYFELVMEAGIDPMYAYRYLSWRLNCPHHDDKER